MTAAHRLPHLTREAIECAEWKLDNMNDEDPALILSVCNIAHDGARELIQRARVDMVPGIEEAHPDVNIEDALTIATSGILAGLCIAVLATDHANGHGKNDRPVRMTDAQVDVALDAIVRGVSRHQGAGADNPDGLADSLRALDDVRAIFREATGIEAPR